MACPAFAVHAPSVKDWLRSSHRHQPLAERTVIELSRQVQQWQSHPAGPEKAPAPVRRRGLRARDRLVCHNLRLVSHVWGRHRQSLPGSDESTADAFQEAALGLVRAAEKYDPGRGYRFSTYASFWVRRGFADVEQQQKRLIRFPVEKASIVLRAQRLRDEHQASTGDVPSLEWLAERCPTPGGRPLTSEGLATLLQQWEETQTGSLEDPANPAGEDNGRLDLAALQQDRRDQQSIDHHLAALPRLLNALTSQQRQVIEGLYLRTPEVSRLQLRRELGLTPQQLRTVEREALGRLREGNALLTCPQRAAGEDPQRIQ